MIINRRFSLTLLVGAFAFTALGWVAAPGLAQGQANAGPTANATPAQRPDPWCARSQRRLDKLHRRVLRRFARPTVRDTEEIQRILYARAARCPNG